MMRRSNLRIFVGGTVLLAAIAGYAQQSALRPDTDPMSEAALIAREKQFAEAFKKRDRAVMGDILAEDAVCTDETGAIFKKAEFINSADDVTVKSYTLQNVKVRRYGNAAVVLGTWRGSISAGGQDTEMALQFTDTFIRHENKWIVVAQHSSKL